MERHEKRIEATYLSKCSPQAAYDWLYDRRIKDVYGYCESYDATLEYLLVRRNDPLIDLAIAKFGHSDKAIKTVFVRGGSGIKCAALSNPHIGYTKCNGLIHGYGDPIVSFAAWFGNKAEQEALTKNSNVNSDFIEDLLSKQGLFQNKSNSEYIQLLHWLGGNSRMKKGYEETGNRYDGSASYNHDRVFYMAWRLAENLPATQEFALALYELLSGTKDVSSSTFKDFPSLMERWRIEDDARSGKPNLSASYLLRTRLADLVTADDNLKNSDDFAERESFYRRFSPWSYKEWPLFIEKDGKDAFDSLVYNHNLWRNEENRNLLHEIAWKKNLDPYLNSINELRQVENDTRKKNPNWFSDEDLRWSNSTDAIVRRLGKLENMPEIVNSLKQSINEFNSSIKIEIGIIRDEVKEIKILHQNINDSISIKFEEFYDKQNSLFDCMLESLESNKQMIIAFRPAPLWPWVIVVLILIFILMK